MARVLVFKKCVCVHAQTAVMNTGYFCFCLVAFLIPLYINVSINTYLQRGMKEWIGSCS